MAASATATRSLAILAAALLVSAVAATDYGVGGTGEWTFNVNYTKWAASKTFENGDNLIFTYSPSLHNVVEVKKSEYEACTANSPIAKHTDGNTTILLAAAGTRYFICSVPNHCQGGMKIEITVSSGATAPSEAPASPSGGSTPGSESPKSLPSGSSAAATLNAAAAITLGAAMVFVAL